MIAFAAAARPPASSGRGVGRSSHRRRVRLRAELRHRLRIFGRELRQRFGELHDGCSDASSSEFVVELARRLPNALRTRDGRVVLSPRRRDLVPAKRVLPLQPLLIFTRVSSAFANDSTFFAMRLALRRVRELAARSNSERGDGIRGSRLPPGVDDVDVAEARGQTAVAHRVDLRRLALAVAERAAEAVAASGRRSCP